MFQNTRLTSKIYVDFHQQVRKKRNNFFFYENIINLFETIQLNNDRVCQG